MVGKPRSTFRYEIYLATQTNTNFSCSFRPSPTIKVVAGNNETGSVECNVHQEVLHAILCVSPEVDHSSAGHDTGETIIDDVDSDVFERLMPRVYRHLDWERRGGHDSVCTIFGSCSYILAAKFQLVWLGGELISILRFDSPSIGILLYLVAPFYQAEVADNMQRSIVKGHLHTCFYHPRDLVVDALDGSSMYVNETAKEAVKWAFGVPELGHDVFGFSIAQKYSSTLESFSQEVVEAYEGRGNWILPDAATGCCGLFP